MTKLKKTYCILSLVFAIAVFVAMLFVSQNRTTVYAASMDTDSISTLDNAAADTATGSGSGSDSRGGLSISINNDEAGVSSEVRALLLLTIIAVSPSLLIMLTSYTRIVIVLHFLRTAIGTQTAPPNQILIGLALFLTFFIMWPTFQQINENAIQPLDNGDITMEEALKEAANQAELVITTGGVSVGQKDLTEEALLSIGAEILFHGIAIKPGMPTLAAEKDGVLFIGLSGNPFSAAIPFEMFVREILSLKMGDPDLKLRREALTAVTGFSKNSRRRRFLRGKAEGKEVWLPDQQANGQMRSMVGCNCLIEIPAGSGPVKAGDKVEVLWL